MKANPSKMPEPEPEPEPEKGHIHNFPLGGISNFEEGYECVLDRGPHLQVQFISLEDGVAKYAEKAFIFRHSDKNLSDHDIYPATGENIIISGDVVGMLIFGLQYIYNDYGEYFDGGEFRMDEKTYPGVKTTKFNSPRFIKFGVFLNNQLNKNITGDVVREYIFKKINYGVIRGSDQINFLRIKSISLKESLIKINDENEVFAEKLTLTLLENE